jgi:hypothetical protein
MNEKLIQRQVFKAVLLQLLVQSEDFWFEIESLVREIEEDIAKS